MRSSSRQTTNSGLDLADELFGETADIAGQVLGHSEGSGPAEVFAVRTSSVAVSFEGSSLAAAECHQRRELAVRLCQTGRVGLAGGSLPRRKEEITDLIARAGAAAITPSLWRPWAPSSVPQSLVPRLPGVSGGTLLSLAGDLTDTLRRLYPRARWRGRVSARIRRGLILNSEGLEAQTVRRSLTASVWATGDSTSAVLARWFRVAASEPSHLVRLLLQRLEGELPRAGDEFKGVHPLPLAIGPELLARILEALARREWHADGTIDPQVEVVDDPQRYCYGSDEEGIPMGPQILIRKGGHLSAWSIRPNAPEGMPSGRGFRPSIEAPPRLRALGLRWRSPLAQVWPKQALLVRELSGLQFSSPATLSGTAPEMIFLEDGRPMAHRAGGVVSISVPGVLHPGVVVSNQLYGVDHHRLPSILLRNH